MFNYAQNRICQAVEARASRSRRRGIYRERKAWTRRRARLRLRLRMAHIAGKYPGIASKGYPSGYQIWYSRLYSANTQSVSVHEAACRAARDVLARGLQTSRIGTASRLD